MSSGLIKLIRAMLWSLGEKFSGTDSFWPRTSQWSPLCRTGDGFLWKTGYKKGRVPDSKGWGMVWGRGAAARGEGVHSLGCRLALCHRTSRSRIPPHCLALTLPLSPPCCTAWGWSLAFSGPHLHDCKVRGMHTLGAPPAEESRDCIRL